MSNPHVNNIKDIIFPDKLEPRPLSRLTFLILSLNIIVIIIMIMGIGLLNRSRDSLINNEIENFATESRIYAELFAGNNSNKNNILNKIPMRPDQQIFITKNDGTLIAEAGELSMRPAFNEMKDKDLNILWRLMAAAENSLSVEFSLPPYPGKKEILNSNTSSVSNMARDIMISAWSAPDGGLILSSEFNINGNKIFLVRRDIELEATYAATRLDITRFIAISLLLTLSFSLYLASVIGHPLRKLAQAAESFRLRKGKGIEIPDMSARKDEIGELSEAMRDMANALSQRISAIEQFAADVAHELKNPLTSMKSAVETLQLTKKEEDKVRLIEILLHDLQRMNRLISDISRASRLDAELSRDEMMVIDLRNVILPLTINDNRIICKGFNEQIVVMGVASRLMQVFDNLISNALSFSPENGKVTITAEANIDLIKIVVEDEGSGIPPTRLNKIFERFYSERPISEGFGMHSGLGLSIAKQIIESHGGVIHAENRTDDNGRIIGARFIVRLRSFVK